MAVNTASLVMVAPATASTTAGGTGLGQLVCQSFSSGAAQFGSLAGCIDLHPVTRPPVTVTVTVTSLRQP